MSNIAQDPELGTPLIPGINLTSTYEALTAQELADRFQRLLAGGQPYIYQRFGTPLISAVERAICGFERGATNCLVFRSGMAAITTMVLATMDPAKFPVILHTDPIYGCTYEFFHTICNKFGFIPIGVPTHQNEALAQAFKQYAGKIGCIFIESPSNPVISITDLDFVKKLRDKYQEANGVAPIIAVDSTFLSPILSHPFDHGADIVIHSATKFLGGHSDVLGGVVLTKSPETMNEIRRYRNVLGSPMDEVSAFLLLRSLDTLELRVRCQASSAQKIAEFLVNHSAVSKVIYPGLFAAEQDSKLAEVFKRTCDGTGSMISIYLNNPSREAAFRMLDALGVFRRAVSLGGTHSLAEHPASTTHAGVPEEVRAETGITENLIRLSVGVEPVEKLIADLDQALAALNT